MRSFSIVVAMDEQRGIGKNGALPWHLPADLKHFKDITMNVPAPDRKNVVIMGRKTWGSLPKKFRPLPGRVNIVLTSNRNIQTPADVLVFNSFDRALEALEADKQAGEIFVIGGAQLFTQTINHPQCVRLYITFVEGRFACDAFFPAIPKRFKETSRTPVFPDPAAPYRFAEFAV